MKNLTPPELRIVGVRFHLFKRRGFQTETAEAFTLETLLLDLAALMRPGAGPVPQASIAAAVERAAQVGIGMEWDALAERLHRTCPCGDDWSEHLTGRGCLAPGCECGARRPHAAELAPVPALAGGELR